MNILNDGIINIATGRSRRETNWKNTEILWSALVKRLSKTHRTAETYSEYLAAKRDRQDEIKDVGGFVGGCLTSGRKKAANVRSRQLLTLDIDFGHSGFWEDYTLLYANAACLYSTHKHQPDSPRLRLIVPLDREVFTDEYEAISRQIAGVLGIEYFDPTTFEPSRLMYWPSTSSDGAFESRFQDGPWLSADGVLVTYRDWKDSSSWPVSVKEGEKVRRDIKAQKDPLEKSGIVGAFCRTYSIAEAISTFLSDVYDPCDIDGRFTYKEGSTTAGLVVYEDKFSFSHHGTDPASGKLCNAFDLVRLHKFGLRDREINGEMATVKLPSYEAMQDLAAKDSRVRLQLGAEVLAEARAEFDGTGSGDETADDSWVSELEVDRQGKYYSTIHNVILILNNGPGLKGRIALDIFRQREIALKEFPWRKVTRATRFMTDKDEAGIRYHLEKNYKITGTQKIRDGLDMVLMQHSFHPIRQYLEDLQWDGTPRVDRLLVDYLGAEDTEYVRTVTRKTLVAAVSRIYRPGCKFDYVLTLVGRQGIGKSALLKKLGREWFSDSIGTVQGKEAYEQIQGVWLVEIAELAGLKKAEMETIKHFISKQEDMFRVAYGRRTENFPRQCIFIGTTNNKDFLRDPTGNRRFWPVDTAGERAGKDLFSDLTRMEVNQVWAEALRYYHEGESLYLSPELEAMAFEVQEEHTEQDDRAELIHQYLESPIPEEFAEKGQKEEFRNQVSIAELWCEALRGQRKDMSNYNTKFIHHIMEKMPGWEKLKTVYRTSSYGVQRGYKRV